MITKTLLLFSLVTPTDVHVDVGGVESTFTWTPPRHAEHQKLKHYTICVEQQGQATDQEWKKIKKGIMHEVTLRLDRAMQFNNSMQRNNKLFNY